MKSNKMEIHNCVLCYNAPCSKMYKNINPERIIRAIRFDNDKGARFLIDSEETCFEKNINWVNNVLEMLILTKY